MYGSFLLIKKCVTHFVECICFELACLRPGGNDFCYHSNILFHIPQTTTRAPCLESNLLCFSGGVYDRHHARAYCFHSNTDRCCDRGNYLHQLTRHRERTRTAREQTSRLESLRSSAVTAAGRANRDADKARAEAQAAMHALETTRDGLAAAQAAHRTAEEGAESERRRLESLRQEAMGLEDGLRAATREVEEREARAVAAAAAAEQEEARLVDCRDSFGLEVEGLQKGVGELESEAVGWRGALEQARSRLAVEEQRGRQEKLRAEAERERLGEAVEGRKVEVKEWETRLEALRRKYESNGERFAREARDATAELHGLKSKISLARSKLKAEQAELQVVSASIEEKVAGVDTAEAAAASLDRRTAELEAHVGDLEGERDRALREGQAARRRQAEELSRWQEAIAERRHEFDGLSELVRGKAASLGDLERQVGYMGWVTRKRSFFAEYTVYFMRYFRAVWFVSSRLLLITERVFVLSELR